MLDGISEGSFEGLIVGFKDGIFDGMELGEMFG